MASRHEERRDKADLVKGSTGVDVPKMRMVADEGVIDAEELARSIAAPQQRSEAIDIVPREAAALPDKAAFAQGIARGNGKAALC